VENKDFSGIRNNGSLPDPRDVNIPADSEELLNDYVESANSMLDELEQAALAYESGNNSEENNATIRRILHKIKGESSIMGIKDISDICHQEEYAFEELGENQRPDMLLRFKDWTCNAIYSMISRM
jgi:chemotaxis protein histidine kinase CheA